MIPEMSAVVAAGMNDHAKRASADADRRKHEDSLVEQIRTIINERIASLELRVIQLEMQLATDRDAAVSTAKKPTKKSEG